MSFENPTRLRIGMHGNFAGKDYRVLGRVVMGESEAGETYYWNEFNLQASDGSSADLVFEDNETGGHWRLFTLFEPEYPLTAADAATKRVGDSLNLTGDDVSVTFRGSSRVYRIEGTAPEGVAVGSVAEYFNCEAGELMQVVSWTGDEVEFYNGVNLSRGMIASAFNLPQEELGGSGGKNFSSFSGSDSDKYTSGLKFALQAGFVILIFFLIFGRTLSCSTDYEASAVKKIPAGPAPLVVGATGKLKDANFRITGHAVVEVAEVGLNFQRHEYQLTDNDGQPRLLVCGLKPDEKNWTIFTPLTPLLPPSAKECAAKKIGEAVNVDGVTGSLREIFLATLRTSEGTPGDGWTGNGVRFGYLAQGDYSSLLVCWDGSKVSCQHGSDIPSSSVAAAFAASPAK